MKCEKYLDMMSLYIDNRLDGKKLQDFEEHINNCSSCQEELNILKEIISDINGLEELELPGQFHQELMSKIQTKPSQKWRIVGAVAAVFFIALLARDNFKLQPTKDAMPESANMQTRSFVMEDAMPAEGIPELARDHGIDGNEIAPARASILHLEQIEIETSAYDNSKDTISQISQDMNLQEEMIEEVVLEEGRELTLQLTLNSGEKHQLISRIQELCEDITITSQETDHSTGVLKNADVTTILIKLRETK